MRSRKHKHVEHENHERWLVSYADFITLLFAFFVVMYAISSVNDGKYRVLSNSLEQAFSKSPMHSLDPIEGDNPLRASNPSDPNDQRNPIAEGSSSAIDLGGSGSNILDAVESAQDTSKESAVIMHDLNEALQPMIDKGEVSLRETDKGVEVEMKSNVLFASGRAELTRGASPLLKDLSKQLLGFSNPVTIQGYTDNQPIANAVFASNWELSAARAAAVANLLNRLRIRTDRLSAIGFGENQPVGDNHTVEGRQKNRRVVMLIASPRNGSSTGMPTPKPRAKAAAILTPVPEESKPWEKIAIEGPASAVTPVPSGVGNSGNTSKAISRVNKAR